MSAPYAQVESEEILIKNGDIELPGTLTYTAQSKDLVLWIHGSGNVDRNGNQEGANVKANYIKQLRDSLNQQNIAFFSYDKRTANRKNAPYLENTLFTSFVEDALKVIERLKQEKQFKSITLVGHSQGSLVAMLASKDVNKYISLAGPSDTIDKTIVEQLTGQNALMGKAAEEHFKELKETGTIKEVNPFLASIFVKQNLPSLKDWMQYDPKVEIKKMKIPTLVINGTKDLQVKEKDAKALKEAQSDAKLVIIENMNHVLKVIEKDSDNYPSYFSPDFKLSPELIQTISEFVKK
jgi:pimeloyl-ACP methyl ester carboxylesterase